MAALLRGVARSFAVVAAAAPQRTGAAAAQPIVAHSTTSISISTVPLSGAGGGVVAAAVVGGGRGVVGVVRSGVRGSGGGGTGGVGGGGGVVIAAAEKSSRVTTVMAASLPGLLGSGGLVARPALMVSPGQPQQQQHSLSSSAAFLAHHRLTMRPQVTQIAHGSNQAFAFQLKAQDGQVVSVEEPAGAAPSTPFREQPRENWVPTRNREGGSTMPGNGRMGGRFNSRAKSVSVRNVGPRGRYINNSAASDVLQDSELYRRSAPTPFRTSREFSSSALLDGFDDNEGSEMDVETYKRTHEITTTGSNVPDPVMTFASTGFTPVLMRELENAGFSSPSAIQAMTWPIASQSRDVVAVAKTGSGKTLGYLMPAFLRLEKERSTARRAPPSVLVLAPTRELANQIRDEAWKFGRSSRISVTCVCGGTSKGPQLRDIERGVDVIVATPGRLNDLLEMRAVDLKKVSYLVLDEADRMLDMGFEPQIRAIVDEMSPKRQTLMYTATWPQEVRRIARDLMTDPVQVNIGNSDQLSANKNITQRVEIIARYDKEKRLDEILGALEPGAKVLIFCTTKRMCDELSFNLRNKYGALALHGDKSQRERDFVMNQFKKGRTAILVATDVAARGLDIKDIRMVINYDFPTGVEDYVHRIGRTGRAGATGIAHTFFGFEDAKHASELVKVLESTGQDVIPELRQMVGRGGRGGGGGRWGSGGRGGGGFRGQGGNGSGSRYGSNGGADRYGNMDRTGGSDRFGSDRYGNGRSGSDRFGGDRFGGDNKFGGDRSGSRYGQRDARGSDSFGSGSKWGGGQGERRSNDRPAQKWGQQDIHGLESLQGLDSYGTDKSLLNPRYGELKVNPDGSVSMW